jgi:hypothetical protein
MKNANRLGLNSEGHEVWELSDAEVADLTAAARRESARQAERTTRRAAAAGLSVVDYLDPFRNL